MTPHVTLEHVTKTFTVYRKRGRVTRERLQVRAVDDITLEIGPGDLCGYIGPNGAGKSTTVKMLTGILVPTTGTVRVAGIDPQRQRIELARRIGVVFGQRTQLWWDLPLTDSFELLRHVYRVPAQRHRENVRRYTDLLDLGDFLHLPVRQLSLGQRMRGDLTAALLHDPEMLYLDEPTIGLDLVSKATVREFLAELNREQGVTVLLTTHDLIDVERLCSRLIVIDRGRIIQDGAVAAIKEQFGKERTLVVDLDVPSPPLDIPGARVVRVEGPRQWLRFQRAETSAAALISAVAAHVPIRDIAIEEPEIEEVVRRIYAGAAPEQGAP